MSRFITFEDRLEIEVCLKENKGFTDIGKKLSKDRTTISKEIRKYSKVKEAGSPNYPANSCKLRKNCRRKKVCGKVACKHPQTVNCKHCESLCNRYCDAYEEEICRHRFKAPYVCNGCREVKKCTLVKTMYSAIEAHGDATERLSEARSGIFSTEGEIKRMNDIIVPLIRQGHSIHQIYVNNKDHFMCCEKTLYNYVEGCLFDVRDIDMPSKVKYRPRYKKVHMKVDRGCRVGRAYSDYELYMQLHPDTAVVQMDSVIGEKGGRVLLTIMFVQTSLMLAFIREANTSQSVIDIFDELYKRLGGSMFRHLFPLVLTDNGSEFSNPKCIENGPSGKEYNRTKIFYCNPRAPYQKPEIEVGHEFIRRIRAKGKSFDDLSQEDVNKMMDHINSYKRKKLNDKSPYESFSFHYGEDFLKRLGCQKVAANAIILKPRLLKKQ